MKKIIVIALFLVPFFAKAEVPANTFFFEDGKGYGLDGQQKYFCFIDSKCYTVDGVFAFSRLIDPSGISFPLIDPITNIPYPIPQVETFVGSVPSPVPTSNPFNSSLVSLTQNNSDRDIYITYLSLSIRASLMDPVKTESGCVPNCIINLNLSAGGLSHSFVFNPNKNVSPNDSYYKVVKTRLYLTTPIKVSPGVIPVLYTAIAPKANKVEAGLSLDGFNYSVDGIEYVVGSKY